MRIALGFWSLWKRIIVRRQYRWVHRHSLQSSLRFNQITLGLYENSRRSLSPQQLQQSHHADFSFIPTFDEQTDHAGIKWPWSSHSISESDDTNNTKLTLCRGLFLLLILLQLLLLPSPFEQLSIGLHWVVRHICIKLRPASSSLQQL